MQRTWILVGAAILIAIILFFFVGGDEPELVTETPGTIEEVDETIVEEPVEPVAPVTPAPAN